MGCTCLKHGIANNQLLSFINRWRPTSANSDLLARFFFCNNCSCPAIGMHFVWLIGGAAPVAFLRVLKKNNGTFLLTHQPLAVALLLAGSLTVRQAR